MIWDVWYDGVRFWYEIKAEFCDYDVMSGVEVSNEVGLIEINLGEGNWLKMKVLDSMSSIQWMMWMNSFIILIN